MKQTMFWFQFWFTIPCASPRFRYLVSFIAWHVLVNGIHWTILHILLSTENGQ